MLKQLLLLLVLLSWMLTLPLALLPLHYGDGAFGMLVLASMDAQRFHGGMGTDFLARIGEVASAALSRLR